MKSAQRRRGGFVLVATTIFAAGMVAFLGMAVDVGYLQWQKLRVQTAADAAANGAILEFQRGSSLSTIINAGRADSAWNGFTNGVGGAVVTINRPPTKGPLAGNSSAVEAIVSRPVSTFFLAVIGQTSATVGARAVAVMGSSGAGGSCVYTLSPSASRAFQINGGSSIYFSCGVNVNSSSSTAFHMEGSAKLYLKNHSGVSVVGGMDLTGQTRVIDFVSGNNVVASKVSSVPDPFQSVQAPSTAGLPVRGTSNQYYDMNRKPAGNTIQPGIYCGGLSIGNTGGATFTLAPGVYVMGGGGLTFNSQAKVAGTGVTIYNTSGAHSGAGGCNSSFAPFNLDGQANVSLSAPTSGPLEAMLIFQDRSITDARNNTLIGGSTTVLNGVIYLPHSPILFSGNSNSSEYLILVADTVSINGNATVNNNYASLEHGSPIRQTAVLAE